MRNGSGPDPAAPLASGASPAPGYTVLTHLARGNALDVYDVWSEMLGCRCILKMPRPDRLAKPRIARALLREGRLLKRLNHPHIVRGYEVIAEPTPIAIIETLGGETLAHMVSLGSGPLAAPEAAQLGLQLSSAIRYLHGRGYLHLDLKPSNVIAEAGRAKLIDLSLARRPGRVRPGTGTWCYLAPEQARGGRVTSAADVWGIGAVLFEAVTGEAPFDDDSDEEYPQLVRGPDRVGDLRPLPDPLEDLVASCLEPEPAARPTVEELLAGLEDLAGTPTADRRWRSSSRRWFSAARGGPSSAPPS